MAAAQTDDPTHTDDPTQTRARGPHRTRLVAASVFTVALGYPLVMAAASGVLGLPRNDDWTYILSARDSAAAGTFVSTSWAAAMTVGQVYLARMVMAVAGPNVLVLDLMGGVLAAVAVVTSFVLVRRFVPQWGALAVSAAVILGPLYASLAPTFMLDLPTMAFEGLALLAIARACRALPAGGRLAIGPLAAGTALTFVAFTIREFALAVVPATVVTVLWLVRGRPARRDLLMLVGVMGALTVAMGWVYLWRQEQIAAMGHDLRLATIRQTAAIAVTTLNGVALLLAPALLGFWLAVLVGRARAHPPRAGGLGSPWRIAAVLCVVMAVIAMVLRLVWPSLSLYLIGNYVSRAQSYWQATANQPHDFLPKPAWGLLTAMTLLSAFTVLMWLAALVARWHTNRTHPAVIDDPDGPGLDARVAFVLSATFGVFTVALPFVAAVARSTMLLDRYLFPAVPYLSAVVLASALRWGLSRQAVALGLAAGTTVLAAYGVWQTSLTATFDATRWDVGTAAVSRGLPAANVDAGYEWWGYHNPPPPDHVTPRVPVTGAGFWMNLYQDPEVCLVTAEGHAVVPGYVGQPPWVQARRSTLFQTEVVVNGFRVPGTCGQS